MENKNTNLHLNKTNKKRYPKLIFGYSYLSVLQTTFMTHVVGRIKRIVYIKTFEQTGCKIK